MTRGNPKLQIRLDPDLMERVQKAFPPVSGRSGGVALVVRQLLHLVLEEPIPEQYGEVRRNPAVDTLELWVRKLDPDRLDNGEYLTLRSQVLDELDREQTPVDLLRLRATLGRLEQVADVKGTVS
jgi:hypothetical protein